MDEDRMSASDMARCALSAVAIMIVLASAPFVITTILVYGRAKRALGR